MKKCNKCGGNIRNISYDTCFKCNYKRCDRCILYKLKSDSKYKHCYDCNKFLPEELNPCGYCGEHLLSPTTKEFVCLPCLTSDK